MTIPITDVEVFLGRDLTADEEVRAGQLIPYAVSLLEARFPGLAVDAVAQAETVIVHPTSDVLWTPRYPVTAVESVEAAGREVTGFQWDEWGRIWADVSAVDDWEMNLTLARWADVAVTYGYGLDPTPLVLVQAVGTMVANVVRMNAANPNAVQSEALGAYQVSYGDFSARQTFAGMSVPEIPGLDYWDRRKRITSAALRS